MTIRTLDEIIHALTPLSAHRTECRQSLKEQAAQQSDAGRDVTGDADSTRRYFLTLSSGDQIVIITRELWPGIWNAWDEQDTSGRGGWGSTEFEAAENLREVLA